MSNKNNLLRITQINAVYLDKEINNSFSQLLQESLMYLPPNYIVPFEPELKLLVRLLIFNYSIIKIGSTFGQQMLCIKYNNLSHIKKAFYILFNCYDYFKYRIEYWFPGHDVNRFLSKIDTALKLLNVLNVTLFLRTGAKPLLVERILGMNQVYCQENAQRHFESKYLARELLWNGLIELFVFVLPLINYYKIRRTIHNLNPFVSKSNVGATDLRIFTLHTKCPHCNKTPILPHHMGCSHIFCYVCLKGNQVADEKFGCSICGYHSPNNLCERVSVQNLK